MRHSLSSVASWPSPSRRSSIAERVFAKMAVLLDCDREHLHAGQRLEADLDFTPLERVQIVLDFEDAESCSVSLDKVALAHTVQDLVDVIADASRRVRVRVPGTSPREYAEWLARGLRRGRMSGRVAA
jgi:acyl carrier protein